MNKHFEEKQYLGYNQFYLFMRLVIAVGCLFSYFFSNETVKDDTSNMFLFLGIAILFVSVALFLVLHIKTEVVDHFIILSGFWTARMVKIDIRNIVSCEKVKYSKYAMKRSVYNLHLKGRIKFYTHGNWAVELTDTAGLKYRIGSQRAEELSKVINNLRQKIKIE